MDQAGGVELLVGALIWAVIAVLAENQNPHIRHPCEILVSLLYRLTPRGLCQRGRKTYDINGKNLSVGSSCGSSILDLGSQQKGFMGINNGAPLKPLSWPVSCFSSFPSIPICFPLRFPFFGLFVIISFSFFTLCSWTVPFLLCYFQMLLALSIPPTHPFIFKLTRTAFCAHCCIDSRHPQQFLKDVLHPNYVQQHGAYIVKCIKLSSLSRVRRGPFREIPCVLSALQVWADVLTSLADTPDCVFWITPESMIAEVW